jgi:hypothetical protein
LSEERIPGHTLCIKLKEVYFYLPVGDFPGITACADPAGFASREFTVPVMKKDNT